MQPKIAWGHGSAGAAYGYAEMGPYSGGQTELLRVPYADFDCLALPPDAIEKENDYVMLSGIFHTGYYATELAGMKPGDSVVIFGSGPVGLMAAHSAMIKGASKVMVVNMHKDRLARVQGPAVRRLRRRGQPDHQGSSG